MNSILTLAQCLWLGVAFSLTLLYFGFGATRLVLPTSLHGWRRWAIPFVGLALVIVWDYIALFLGFNLTLGTTGLFVVATVLNLAVLVRARPDPRALRLPRATSLGALLLACLTFVLGIAPLLRYGYLTVIGENWDYEFYLPLADYLKAFTMEQLPNAQSNPLLPVVTGPFIGRIPMGFSYLHTTMDVLWRFSALDSFAALLAFARALGVLACYPFFRLTLKMSARAALFATALYASSGLLLWTTYWGFGLQLASLALLPPALAFGAHALMARDARAVPLAALMLAALNVTYHPTFVAALLPFGLIGVYVLAVQPERFKTLWVGAGLLVLAFALSFPALFHIPDFIREFYVLVRLGFGVRDFVPLSDGLGFSLYTLNLIVGQTIATPWLFAWFVRVWDWTALPLTLLALGLMLLALIRLRQQPERRAIWYLLGGAYLLYLLLLRLPYFHPYPYGFIKALSLVIFLGAALIAEGAAALPGTLSGFLKPPRVRQIQYALVAVLLAANLLTLAGMFEQYFKPAPPFFGADDLRLRQAAQMLPAGATLFLTDRPEVQKLPLGLAAYFFQHAPLYGQVKTGYGGMDNTRAGEVYDLALLARGEDPAARGYATTPAWSNQKFALYPRERGVIYQRALDVQVFAANPLTLNLGASEVVTNTAVVDTSAATRGLTLAFAAFAPQTIQLELGQQKIPLALEPGLSTYMLPAVPLPNQLVITSGEIAATNANSVYVAWAQLRDVNEAGAHAGDSAAAPTNAVLVQCPGIGASPRGTACLIANPGGAQLRWEFVVRGLPKGTFDDQELLRASAVASPRNTFETDGETVMRFDDIPTFPIPPRNLPAGKYRAALEVFNGEYLVGRIDLYNFVFDEQGRVVERTAPPTRSPVILKP